MDLCGLRALGLLATGSRITLALSASVVLVVAGCNVASHRSSANFASGGLGLSRREWERRHGPALAQDSAEVHYRSQDGGSFFIGFVNGNVHSLRRFEAKPLSLDEARNEANQLIPTDSSLTRTFTFFANKEAVLDRYHSESLKSRFSGESSNWTGGEPGDFTISYSTSAPDNTVDGFGIRAGDIP